MSLLVRYTLRSTDDHAAQKAAMQALVAALRSEAVPVDYSCFATGEPTRFLGLLEFADDAGRQAFLASRAFSAYRETVAPILAGPPETTEIAAVASTRV